MLLVESPGMGDDDSHSFDDEGGAVEEEAADSSVASFPDSARRDLVDKTREG